MQRTPKMTHMMDKLLKSQLEGFMALVFLLLTHSGGGQSQVTGTSLPIVAMIGDDAVLPCHLETATDATHLTAEWTRSDLEPRFVYFRRDGVEFQQEQNPLYTGRTSLSTNKLKFGDISLKLSKVRLSDAGTYRCLVPKSGTESAIVLTVGSISKPEVEISKLDDGLSLDCKSKGWYPEPEVLWLDGEGHVLSAGPTETVRGPDDLYTVSSRVTVDKRHSNSFTCRVQQNHINQTRETQIQISVDFFMVQSSFAARISICLVVCIIPIVVVVFIVCKWGKNKKETTDKGIELQLMMGGEADREKFMTESEKITYLENAKAKVEEEFKKTEEELKHVEQVIKTLKTQKTDLKDQREKLISLQQEDKIQIKENEKKLREIPKTDKAAKMQKREKIKQDLCKRQAEHDALLKSTDNLLETTEKMIIQMTEKKGKLERDQEKLTQHLKETERQREEIQRKLRLETPEREDGKTETLSRGLII